MSFLIIYGSLSFLVLAGTFFVSYGLLKGNSQERKDRDGAPPAHRRDGENEELLDLGIAEAELTIRSGRSGGIRRAISHILNGFRPWPSPFDRSAPEGKGTREILKGWLYRLLALFRGRREAVPQPPDLDREDLLSGSGKGVAIGGKVYWPPRPLLSYKSFSSRSKEKVRVKY